MPGTTPSSAEHSALFTPQQFDRLQEKADSKLIRTWRSKDRLTDMIMSIKDADGKLMNVEYNCKGNEHVWDFETEEDTQELLNWGHLTEIQVSEHAQRVRMSEEYDYVYHAIPITEVMRDQADAKDKAAIIRNYIDELKTSANGHFSKKLNSRLASGTGVLSSVDGRRNRQLTGYQTALQDTPSGTIYGIARSNNTFVQNQTLAGNGGSGSSFATDAIERNQVMIDLTTVDYDGEEHQANLGLAGKQTLRILKQAYQAKIDIQVTMVDKTSGMVGDFGTKAVVFEGIPFIRDSEISSSNNRLYYFDTRTWHLKSKYPKLFQLEPPRTLEAMVGKDQVSCWKAKLAMICKFLPTNGVMTNTF